jgi:hypothetical protein
VHFRRTTGPGGKRVFFWSVIEKWLKGQDFDGLITDNEARTMPGQQADFSVRGDFYETAAENMPRCAYLGVVLFDGGDAPSLRMPREWEYREPDLGRRLLNMPFIQTIHESEARGKIKEVYEKRISHHSGKVSNIAKIFSLRPDLLEAQHIFSRAIQFGGSSLGVKREEMISVLVGALLKCSY